MTVRPNPHLDYHAPEGDTAVRAADVLYRLLEPSASPHTGGVGDGIPHTYFHTLLFNTVWGPVKDTLGTDMNALVQHGINTVGQLVNDSGPLVAELLLLIDAARAKAQQLTVQASRDMPLVDQALVTADALLAEAERQAEAAAGSTGPLLDQVTLTLDAWKNTAEEQADAALQDALNALNDLDAEGQASEIVNVVPLAVAAPPNVVSNIMANPNMPDGAREENDGSGAYWTVPEGAKDCARITTNAYDRYVCWRIERQDYDNDPNRNFWQFHVDVSGRSLERRFMERMWVEGKPAPEGASNQRFDAIPAPAAEYGGSEGCSTTGHTFQLASGSPVQSAFGYYWERTACETYKPKTYEDDGHWASIWEGNDWVKWDVQRAIMLKVPVKTPADKGMQWELLTGQRTIR